MKYALVGVFMNNTLSIIDRSKLIKVLFVILIILALVSNINCYLLTKKPEPYKKITLAFSVRPSDTNQNKRVTLDELTKIAYLIKENVSSLDIEELEIKTAGTTIIQVNYVSRDFKFDSQRIKLIREFVKDAAKGYKVLFVAH